MRYQRLCLFHPGDQVIVAIKQSFLDDYPNYAKWNHRIGRVDEVQEAGWDKGVLLYFVTFDSGGRYHFYDDELRKFSPLDELARLG